VGRAAVVDAYSCEVVSRRIAEVISAVANGGEASR